MFLEKLGQVVFQKEVRLKVCLSSRHYPHIGIKRGHSLTIEDQTGHSGDIVTYIQIHLIQDQSPEMASIRTDLCEKALDVFLWVILVVLVLNKVYGQGRISAMRKRLDEIPTQLDHLFAEILARDNENEDDSILLVQWCAFAQRPLTPKELYLAVVAGSSEDIDDYTFDPGSIKRFIIGCSKGLVEESKSEPPRIQLIHETVRDFLLQKNGLAKFQPELGGRVVGLSQNRLVEICFRYFLRSVQHYEPNGDDGTDESEDVVRI